MNKQTKNKVTKADLKRQIMELKAQLPVRDTTAYSAIDKAHTDKCLGSGVIVSMVFLGGNFIFEPVLISDGLSQETIDAIKTDLRRSQELKTMYKIGNKTK